LTGHRDFVLFFVASENVALQGLVFVHYLVVT